jgi:hypothetical protein
MSPQLKAILDELEESFDKQIDPEQVREDYDAPDDREYSVNITAKQWRAFSRAMNENIIPQAIKRAERRDALKHLRDALAMANSDQSHAYRVGYMEACIKGALVELGSPVNS